jgi:hypothetical protein
MDQPIESSQADDLTHALNHAQSDECRLWLARRIDDARERAGVYASVIQGPLTADLREILARELLKESKHE